MRDHSRNRRWLLRALAATFGAGVATVTGLPGASRARAACGDQPVFDACKDAGHTALHACAFDDWACKCAANTALQNCYLTCVDDPEIQAEAQEVAAARQQSCSLAA
ncbi:hypothetical protein Lesp02_37460 [Lentzea sp. NBRC 105346]|nr:hypothetical protein Lesp02_37460 [Lentzea sp. NBRC 105346]